MSFEDFWRLNLKLDLTRLDLNSAFGDSSLQHKSFHPVMMLYTRRELIGGETGLWLAKQQLGVKARHRTPFGYARAQLHGRAPSQVTWRRSGPQSSMDVYTKPIMNHQRRSFIHIWQRGKWSWNHYPALCLANKVSFGLWFWFRWDPPTSAGIEQKKLIRIYQKHSSTSNTKPFHSAQYAHYNLPSLFQVMLFPWRGGVTWQQNTQHCFLRNKLVVSCF